VSKGAANERIPVAFNFVVAVIAEADFKVAEENLHWNARKIVSPAVGTNPLPSLKPEAAVPYVATPLFAFTMIDFKLKLVVALIVGELTLDVAFTVAVETLVDALNVVPLSVAIVPDDAIKLETDIPL
jgi:hypothetical protein